MKNKNEILVHFSLVPVPAAMNECVQEWFIMQNGLSSEDVESFTLTERVIARKKPTKIAEK